MTIDILSGIKDWLYAIDKSYFFSLEPGTRYRQPEELPNRLSIYGPVKRGRYAGSNGHLGSLTLVGKHPSLKFLFNWNTDDGTPRLKNISIADPNAFVEILLTTRAIQLRQTMIWPKKVKF